MDKASLLKGFDSSDQQQGQRRRPKSRALNEHDQQQSEAQTLSRSGTQTATTLPRLGEHEDVDFVESSFDPANLLEVDINEWRDRTLSLQSLRKSRTVGFHDLPSIVERSNTYNSGASSMSLRQPSILGRAPTRTWQSVTSELTASVKRMLSTNQFGPPLGSSVPSESSEGNEPAAIPEQYYRSLANAPHASLIHIIAVYHQLLVSHGLTEEASKIASLVEGLNMADDEVTAADLHGMDLLLKDGLLQLYLRIQPYLPPVPSQIVKFKSLSCTTNMLLLDGGYETVLTKAIGFIMCPFRKKKKPEKITVLNDITGYLMPGTMTLVLGPPGCGKNSLLTVLSGRAQPGSVAKGWIKYNHRDLNDVGTHHLVANMGASDDHLPFITVRETLEFARECLLAFGPNDYGPELKQILGDALKMGQDPKLEINMSMMGLKYIANRIAGSPAIPSISEDERRRLTAAEMFSGAHAVYFWDQSNIIAEDSITYDLLSSIRILSRVRQITFMASLLQPSSEIFELFDRLIILNDGQIVYQGPRQDALAYFERLGYKKPKHLGIGEYLQEVTTEVGAAYLKEGGKRMQIEDFVTAYKSSGTYMDIRRVVDNEELVQEIWVQGAHPLGVNLVDRRQPNSQVQSPSYSVLGINDRNGSLVNISMDHTTSLQPDDKLVAFGSPTEELKYIENLDTSAWLKGSLQDTLAEVQEPVRLQFERKFQEMKPAYMDPKAKDYVLDWKSEFVLLTKRELKSIWRSKLGLKLRLAQVLIMSLFVGFLVFQINNDADQSNMNLFRTAFFMSVLNMTMFNAGQLPTLMDERNVYYKQRRAHFFRPISYLLAKIVSSIPFSLCEGTIWTIIVYFLSGMPLTSGGWHFFVYYVVIILIVLNGASMIRLLSFLAPNKEKAGMFIGVVISLFVLFAGFLVPRFIVPKYWLWVYYLNPLQWAISSMVVNEFNSDDYSLLCKDVVNITSIPQCENRPENTIGHAYLARGQFYTSNSWIAVSVGVLSAWLVVWALVTYLAISKLQHGNILKSAKATKSGKKTKEIELEDIENRIRILSLSPVPVTLSWHELSYDVVIPAIKKRRPVLKHVSGWGEPNEMIAFMGSSGAGKSTLLNCLAGRKIENDNLGGQILINGFPKVQKSFSHVMGYVDKIDAYAPYMTVKETVAYSAALRLGKTSSKQQQKIFVEEVLEMTGLNHLENALVISLTNDITFVQEKKLGIATELVANPSILFLDDPIKRLDSISAAHVTKCLQDIANTGRLVLATLNYPSHRVLSMFTKVQILKNGENVYFGPVGKDCEIVRSYFEAIPGTPRCSLNKSIPTYILHAIGDRKMYGGANKDFAFEYRVSELALRNHIHLQHIRRSKGKKPLQMSKREYRADFVTMVSQVFSTVQKQYWRNVNYTWGRIITFLMMSILLGSVYYKVDMSTTAGMNTRAGAIFISCLLVGITNAQNVIPQVIQMRAVYKRERSVQQFHASLYNIAYALGEIPYVMFANLIFCCIFLPMTNIAVGSAQQFFRYWFISSEFYAVITFLGMLLAAASPIPPIASVLVPIFVGIWVATGGLVVPRNKIKPYFIWIHWTNPLQYTLDGLTSVSFYCDLNKPTCLNNGLNQACGTNPTACPSCDCPRLTDSLNNAFAWKQISTVRSLDYNRVPYDMLALFVAAVIIRFLTFMAIKYMKHYKRT